MGERSSIEWTDATWNPVTGCTKVSEGCRNCYAERLAPRLGQDFSEIKLHPERLEYPLHWKEPRRIFVNSLSDLFHEDISDKFIKQVVDVMLHRQGRHHIYQILTKRPERMLQLLGQDWWVAMGLDWIRHIWLGVSVEDQQTADERIPVLLQTPAAVRFVSAEPLLGPIGLDGPPLRALSVEVDHLEDRRLDWVIVGGESGPQARPMHPDWIRLIRDQCVAASVPFFFKQWGEWFCDDPRRFGSNPYERKPAFKWLRHNGSDCCMWKIGKKIAGRLLDGREWNECPR